MGLVASRNRPLHINFAKANAGDEVDVSPRMMLPCGCNSNNITKQTVKVKKAQNNGKVSVEGVDMVSSSSAQGLNCSELTAMDDAFNDFDMDDLCLKELDWVANGNI